MAVQTKAEAGLETEMNGIESAILNCVRSRQWSFFPLHRSYTLEGHSVDRPAKGLVSQSLWEQGTLDAESSIALFKELSGHVQQMSTKISQLERDVRQKEEQILNLQSLMQLQSQMAMTSSSTETKPSSSEEEE
jgi:hypothetical protein